MEVPEASSSDAFFDSQDLLRGCRSERKLFRAKINIKLRRSAKKKTVDSAELSHENLTYLPSLCAVQMLLTGEARDWRRESENCVPCCR